MRDSLALGEDLVIGTGRRVEATGGSVTLRGGDDVTVLGEVVAVGLFVVRGDHGNADSQGTVIQLVGSLSASSVEIHGDSDSDTIEAGLVTLVT